MTMPYQPLFPLAKDETPYRLITKEGVRVEKMGDKEFLVVEREAIRRLEAEGLVTFELNVGAQVALIQETEYLTTMQTLALVASLKERGELQHPVLVGILDRLEDSACTFLSRNVP